MIANTEQLDYSATSLRCHPDAMGQRVGDAMVLVHLRTNRVYELNRTAARTWEMLADRLTLQQIEDALLGEFAISRETLRDELVPLLDRLRREELVMDVDD